MPDLDTDFSFANSPDQIDVPLLDVQLINEGDTLYNDPSQSFWMDKQNSGKPPFVIGRVLRTDKATGMMKVIGVSEDIAVEVPITSPGNISGDQLGDVSQPSEGAQVLLARTENDDYYPITYFRNFSEEQGFNYGVPDEIDEGDMAWATKGGGKLYVFENGMVQIESAPNCVRLMHPIDNGEKISDICREYGLFTDSGTLIAKRRGAVGDVSSLIIEAPESAGSNPDPLARMTLGALNDAGTETGLFLQALQTNIKGVETSGASIKLTKAGISLFESAVSALIKAPISTIESSKINLGDDKVIEPAVLGAQLLSRLSALESFVNLHTHVTSPTGGTSNVPLPLFANAVNYISKTVFLK